RYVVYWCRKPGSSFWGPLMIFWSLERPALTPQLLLHSGFTDRIAFLTSPVYRIPSRTDWD
ncbi:hypothetical protein J6590_088112, partial [Homalodisca vitripennis]